MSADHPGRNYYEDQFGERIRAIGRGSSRTPSSSDRSGGYGTGAKTAGGVGGVILMVLIFGGLRAWRATTTTTPSYSYPPPRIQIPQQPPNVNAPLRGEETVLTPGDATVTGTVTFDGDVAALGLDELNAGIVEMVNDKARQDSNHCLAEKAGKDREQQAWVINPGNKGLKNVAVFLMPERGSRFGFKEDDQVIKDAKDKKLEIHQPYCAFHPHVAVLFPEYKDKDNPKKKHSTGQKAIVFNDTDKAEGGIKGGISHNTAWGDENKLLPIGQSMELTDLAVSTKSPTTISCKIHGWMNAHLWVLDNPYFDVTNDKGEFTIKHAPVGKVKIVVWHEKAGGLPDKGESIELKKGENKKDFKATK
jgi:hypothetical protein